jgi:hypothetical protein
VPDWIQFASADTLLVGTHLPEYAWAEVFVFDTAP